MTQPVIYSGKSQMSAVFLLDGLVILGGMPARSCLATALPHRVRLKISLRILDLEHPSSPRVVRVRYLGNTPGLSIRRHRTGFLQLCGGLDQRTYYVWGGYSEGGLTSFRTERGGKRRCKVDWSPNARDTSWPTFSVKGWCKIGRAHV